jgi:transcriptional regulator
MSVHAQGKMEFMSEEAFMTLMRKFTLKFEGNNSESLTVLDQLPESYVQKLMPAIIGFEMKVDHLKHVFKLSQNKDEVSYTTIKSKLEAKGGMEALLAEVMQKKKTEFFPPQEE